MYIFEQEDIRDKIENLLKDDCSTEELKTVILEFVQNFENKDVFSSLFVDNEIFTHLAVKLNITYGYNIVYDYNNVASLFDTFNTILEAAEISFEDKKEFLRDFAEILVDNSDDEDFCDSKIFVVIRNIDGQKGNDLIQEYNSLEEAIKDTDENYTSCCDDIYWGESVLYTLLCALQSNEYDYVVNYCKVFEYDAMYVEEGREAWEEENCEPDD